MTVEPGWTLWRHTPVKGRGGEDPVGGVYLRMSVEICQKRRAKAKKGKGTRYAADTDVQAGVVEQSRPWLRESSSRRCGRR